MSQYDGIEPGAVLTDANVSEFIGEMGIAISEAQMQLDTNSINQLAILADTTTPLGQQNLLQLGFTPAFYHYQYADLSVSMQIRLQVGKSFGLGVQAGASYRNTQSSESDTSDKSASSSSTQVGGDIKIAELKLAAAGPGTVQVNGNDVQVTGDDPKDRARKLTEAIRSNPAHKIAIAIFDEPDETFTIAPDSALTDVEKKLKITKTAVAVIARTSDAAIIQVKNQADTSYVLNSSITVDITGQTSISNHAQTLQADIDSHNGFKAERFDLSKPLKSMYFKTGDHVLEAFSHNGTAYNNGNVTGNGDFDALTRIANTLTGSSVKLVIEGFADKQTYAARQDQSSQEQNKKLGARRAEEIKKYLVKNGMDEDNIETISNGNAAAHADGASPQDDINYRKAEIKVKDGAHFWVLVTTLSGTSMSTIDPDLTAAANLTDNGFIAWDDKNSVGLAGKIITIEDVEFTFNGNNAVSLANNLSSDINSGGHPFSSRVEGNVVTLYRNNGEFTITLASDGTAEITLNGSGTVNVSSNFSSTKSKSDIRSQESKKSFAVGVSADVRFSRQFDLAVTGNSSIQARLVSVPAPPTFLKTIEDYITATAPGVALTPPDLPAGPLITNTNGNNTNTSGGN